jgi:KDEL-tailed cysteine endopeptidase
MRVLSIVSFFLFGVVSKASLIDRFENWVQHFKVHFLDEHHYLRVFTTWSSNDKFIEEINASNLTYSLGHNQFSGMDSEEFRQYLGLSGPVQLAGTKPELNAEDLSALPVSVSWVDKGGVTPVKDQGQCGSCWSFSTTGALEGAYFNKYGKLESFSEQQLVDCDNFRNGGKDHGCKGGLMDNAFSWIQKNGGLCSEFDYPYVSGETKTEGTCQTTCSVNKKSNVLSFVDVSPSSDDAMMLAVSKQPVAIAIEADQREFQLYKSGVFTGACGVKLDHGVLVVGYGSLSGQDYYLVKNSWSESWGNKGYIMLGRGKDFNNGDGQCGLLLQGSYPTV